MTEITNLNDYKEANSPHQAGPAQCIECGHKWEAVAPVSVVSFKCPKCGTNKGVWSGVCLPSDEKVVHCSVCENTLFFLLAETGLCAKCGVEFKL